MTGVLARAAIRRRLTPAPVRWVRSAFLVALLSLSGPIHAAEGTALATFQIGFHLVWRERSPGFALDLGPLVGWGTVDAGPMLLGGPFGEVALRARGPSLTLGVRGGGGYGFADPCATGRVRGPLPLVIGLGEVGYTWLPDAIGLRVGGRLRGLFLELGGSGVLPVAGAGGPARHVGGSLGVQIPTRTPCTSAGPK